MNFADNLTELVATAFPDSEIAKSFTLSTTKASYVINHGLAHYYERKISKDLQSCEYLVAQFDESLNRISKKQQMNVHIRFIDPMVWFRQNMSRQHFCSVVQLNPYWRP